MPKPKRGQKAISQAPRRGLPSPITDPTRAPLPSELLPPVRDLQPSEQASFARVIEAMREAAPEAFEAPVPPERRVVDQALEAAELVYADLTSKQRAAVRPPTVAAWWWHRYSAPTWFVRTIDGDEIEVGQHTGGAFLRAVHVRAKTMVVDGVTRLAGPVQVTPRRRRRGRDDVAKAVRWYYQHAAGATFEQLAEQDHSNVRTVGNAVRWLKAELQDIPIAVTTDTP